MFTHIREKTKFYFLLIYTANKPSADGEKYGEENKKRK
jgi:hypothetical protein